MKYLKPISFIILTLISTGSFAQTSQNSLHFDGSNDFVQTSYSGIPSTGARTIEAWIKTTANCVPGAGGVQNVIADYGTFTTGARFTFNLLWSNAPRIEVGGSGLSSTNAVNDGNWHHVAVTFDPNASDQYSIYIDGALDTAGNITTSINTGNGNNLVIGKRIDNVNHFNGNIDEVRVWNTARTAAQIDSFYNKEICPIYNDLVAYYRFNQGSASGSNSAITTLLDKTSNANNGSLNNFGLSGSSSNWVSGSSITSAPYTDSTWSVSKCKVYITPSGQFVFTNKVVKETYTNSIGCDSFVTINVTIKPESFVYTTATACDSFITAKGNVRKTTGIFDEVFTNIHGCDSTVQTLLQINKSATESIQVSRCLSYTSPSGNHTWLSSGNYSDTIQTTKGCDSIIYVDLTINTETYGSTYDTACVTYFSPQGRFYTSSGTYLDTLKNADGCDSILTIYLTINQPSDSTIMITACDSFTSSSGQSTWYNSGNTKEYFTNSVDCDSVVWYQVEINKSTSSVLNIAACDVYVSPAGNSYTTSGIYNEIIVNSVGCDSAITLSLNVTNNLPVISRTGNILSTNINNSTYQWLDCDNNYTTINNETNQDFTPTSDGTYAVEIFDNNCRDTSECYNFTKINVKNQVEDIFEIYPNPTDEVLNITLKSGTASYFITNHLGAIIDAGELNKNTQISTTKYANGIYFLVVEINDKRLKKQFLIEH